MVELKANQGAMHIEYDGTTTQILAELTQLIITLLNDFTDSAEGKEVIKKIFLEVLSESL